MSNMPKYEIQVQDADERSLFALRPEEDMASITEPQVHVWNWPHESLHIWEARSPHLPHLK
jgi:hypothetical protein